MFFGTAYPKVFLSRSPAMVPSDAKLIEVVNEKPADMTNEHWKFLCSLRFGLVVFSAPLGEMASLPYQVGEGDLDGDLVRQHCLFLLSCIYIRTFSLVSLSIPTYNALLYSTYACSGKRF